MEQNPGQLLGCLGFFKATSLGLKILNFCGENLWRFRDGRDWPCSLRCAVGPVSPAASVVVAFRLVGSAGLGVAMASPHRVSDLRSSVDWEPVEMCVAAGVEGG